MTEKSDTMEIQPSSSESFISCEQLFLSILKEKDVFYRHQQRDDPDLTDSDKLKILQELYEQNPSNFISRYHKHIQPEFCELFSINDYVTEHYLKEIKKKADKKEQKQARNQRYLQMLELRKKGDYFSNEKMREREPALFDLMVGQYLDDTQKTHLRPTVDRPDGSFSQMMQQFEESQQISDRRKRHLTDWTSEINMSDPTDRFYSHVDRKTAETDEEFEEEFDSDDEEGIRQKAARHCAKKDETVVMKIFGKIGEKIAPVDPEEEKFEVEYDTDEERTVEKEKISNEKVDIKFEIVPEDPSPSSQNPLLEVAFDACNVTPKSTEKRRISNKIEFDSDEEDADLDLSKEILYQEFVAHMEQRFMRGQDEEFYDYENSEINKEIDKIKERDLEEAYFDDE